MLNQINEFYFLRIATYKDIGSIFYQHCEQIMKCADVRNCKISFFGDFKNKGKHIKQTNKKIKNGIDNLPPGLLILEQTLRECISSWIGHQGSSENWKGLLRQSHSLLFISKKMLLSGTCMPILFCCKTDFSLKYLEFFLYLKLICPFFQSSVFATLL